MTSKETKIVKKRKVKLWYKINILF
jgi:hypothetical protein